jgi:hypothetical protein
MQPTEPCERCRGIERGWKVRFLALLYVTVTVCLIALFPKAEPAAVSGETEPPPVVMEPSGQVMAETAEALVASIEDIIGRHSRLDPSDRLRIARAVVTSGRKYNVDPFLIASILLVESSGDRFAISGRDAVGLMQIHLPTWGSLVDEEQLSLFSVEDNIDLGARILRDYTRQHGLWGGVLRYLGVSDPSDHGDAYLRRVQGIYTDRLAD